MLVDCVSDYAIYMLDPAGIVRSWNLGAERIKGYKADEIIGQCQKFPKTKHDDLVDTVSMAMRYLRRTGMIQRSEEVQEQYDQAMQHTGAPPQPLYGI